MKIHELHRLQGCIENEEVRREVMVIYHRHVQNYLRECHRELTVILGPPGFLVLALFERPSLLDDLEITLMEQFPKVQYPIRCCLEGARQRLEVQVQHELLAYLESVMGISAYYLLASVVS